MKFHLLKHIIVCLLTLWALPFFSQSDKMNKLLNSAKQEMQIYNYREAIDELNNILKKEENNTDALFLRGICNDSLKLYAEALSDYSQVIAFSSNIQVYKNRAILSMKLGKYRQAIFDFDSYLDVYSNDANAYYYRAQSKMESNKPKGAIEDENKAIELDPNFTFLKGNNVDKVLNGQGVVVGIIDGGFDYTHPTFYDSTYSNLRIAKAWIQDLSGTPPEGFNYGAEFKDEESLLQKKFDFVNYGSHGTGVSSVAAGSGLGSQDPKINRGIAYESELVLVSSPRTYQDWRDMNMTTIIDGINYIFSYAQSQNKPAVINISLGSLLGARDGESPFDKACDSLVGPGKILVFCAMNEGHTKKHIGKSFTASDTVLHTFVPIDIYNNVDRRNYIEAWGDSLQSFCLQFGMYSNGIVKNKSEIYCTDNSLNTLFLLGSDNDTCYITLNTKAQEYNKKSHATIDVYSKSKDTLALSVFAKNTNVHMWQDYFDESWEPSFGAFLGNNSWATEGDDNYTIGEMGCTKSAITVGASVIRFFWKDLQDNFWLNSSRDNCQGMLADYSSKGPALDNRMKPDITAPGGIIICASNSYDTTSIPAGSYAPYLVSEFQSPKNGRTYYYTATQGTSFASPMVAGIIALMLQVSPDLTPEQIKDILQKTAIKDDFTSQTPDPAKWGAGKINTYDAIKETILLDGAIDITINEEAIHIKSDPSQAYITLDYESDNSGYLFIEVSDSLGKVVQTKVWQLSKGKNQIDMNLFEGEKGIYFIRITGQGGQIEKKLNLN